VRLTHGCSQGRGLSRVEDSYDFASVLVARWATHPTVQLPLSIDQHTLGIARGQLFLNRQDSTKIPQAMWSMTNDEKRTICAVFYSASLLLLATLDLALQRSAVLWLIGRVCASRLLLLFRWPLDMRYTTNFVGGILVTTVHMLSQLFTKRTFQLARTILIQIRRGRVRLENFSAHSRYLKAWCFRLVPDSQGWFFRFTWIWRTMLRLAMCIPGIFLFL